jgi:hypothetical protein
MNKLLTRFTPIEAALLLLLTLAEFGCGGAVNKASQTETSSSSSSITITVSPATATVQAGALQQFTAVVSGTANTALTWAVNNTPGGNSTVGTISSSGVYAAPTSVSSPTVTVTATSVADTTKSASSTVNLTAAPPGVNVSIAPTSVSLSAGGTQQFTAAVSGTTNTAVTWTATGGTIASSGLYTAPSTTGSYTIQATSVADSTKSASATVAVSAASGSVSVAITPTSVSVAGGATQQFSATVSGTSNSAVNWLVNNTTGGSSTVGTISSAGLYSAPACSSLTGVTVTAQSVYDTSKTASSSVTLTSASSSSSDRYVSPSGSDSNNGSACSPWASIEHATAAAQPGWTVHVAPGTYTAAVTTSVSGTASARIRFISDTRWGAKIKTTGAYQVWNNTANYIDIVGFDISGDGNQGILNYASNVRVIGNHVHDIIVPNIGCNEGGAGIDHASYTASNNDTIGNLVDHIGTTNSQSCGQGIYHAVPGGHIFNNIVNNVTQYGIQLWHAATNVSIANNLAFNCSYGGIMVGAGDAGATTADNVIVTNNIVLNDTYYGIREEGSTGTHNVYANNLALGSSTQIYLQNGLSATNTVSADPKFVNYQANGSGDYHLSSGSPAIDHGTSQVAPTDDLDGAPRHAGAGIDSGPY